MVRYPKQFIERAENAKNMITCEASTKFSKQDVYILREVFANHSHRDGAHEG